MIASNFDIQEQDEYGSPVSKPETVERSSLTAVAPMNWEFAAAGKPGDRERLAYWLFLPPRSTSATVHVVMSGGHRRDKTIIRKVTKALPKLMNASMP